MRLSLLLTAATPWFVCAHINGFNYGATRSNSEPMTEVDFETAFNRAKTLPDTNGRFTSARLFTTIQAGTAHDPSSAIPAAIKTQTRLLLGIWASAGPGVVSNEILALISAASQYGSQFTNLIDGISVGSEDLYRKSPLAGNGNPGATAEQILGYIEHVRTAIRGNPLLGDKKIGHVDTWTAWVDGANRAVIDHVDWLGVDIYPYFQNTMANGIDVANSTFHDALRATTAASKGKEIWVTETSWPVSGPTENLATASIGNAQRYWDAVACPLFETRNTWFFLLWAGPNASNPDFALLPAEDIRAKPRYPLSCPSVNDMTSSILPSSTSPSSTTLSITVTASHASLSATPTNTLPAKSCSTSIDGEYQFPHLIVPVSVVEPDKAFGNGFNATIDADISTIFSFDIPAWYAHKTCSVNFLFNTGSWPYSLKHSGGVTLSKLDQYANGMTTYANKPRGHAVGEWFPVNAGDQYALAIEACDAGKTISYELQGTNGFDLEYFEGGKPLPLGLFITTC